AGALRLAEAAGSPTLALDPRNYPDRRTFDLDLFARIAASGADLLVLAGYMRILDGEALHPWVGRMINIHPSLLPKYRGLHTHRRALEAGDREHGASVHFVTAELDGGPVIAQARLAIEAGDDEHRLAQRLLPLEHQLLPAVLRLLANGRLQWDDHAPRLDGQPLPAPLALNDRELLASE
ncbi:MAG TPA: phosphoribosylglycinamide formyltransferase, partial [Rhodanobacter sp.]